MRLSWFFTGLMVVPLFAADRSAGENERKTLEAQRYTPTSDREVLVAKMLSGWPASIVAARGGSWIYAINPTPDPDRAGTNQMGGLVVLLNAAFFYTQMAAAVFPNIRVMLQIGMIAWLLAGLLIWLDSWNSRRKRLLTA